MNGFSVDFILGLQLLPGLMIEQVLAYGNSIIQALSNIFAYSITAGATDSNVVMGIDMSIEGLRSQKYSVGIFVFLLI